jgi:hypothetical protein
MLPGGSSRKTWMSAEAGCEGIEMMASLFGVGGCNVAGGGVYDGSHAGISSGRGSSLFRIWRNRSVLLCNVVNTLGEDKRVEMACDEVVASMAGREAEKTDADELIRWCWHTTLDPAQNPPPAPRDVASEPMMMSTSEACG